MFIKHVKKSFYHAAFKISVLCFYLLTFLALVVSFSASRSEFLFLLHLINHTHFIVSNYAVLDMTYDFAHVRLK